MATPRSSARSRCTSCSRAASIPKTALAASEGWGGDRYQAFRDRNHKECVRIAIEGDTPSDSAEIGAAFDSWAATMPAGATGVAHDGNRTTVTACESTATAPTIGAIRRRDELAHHA